MLGEMGPCSNPPKVRLFLGEDENGASGAAEIEPTIFVLGLSEGLNLN